jgi:hypothetical protein
MVAIALSRLGWPDPIDVSQLCLPLDCSGVSVASGPGFGFPDQADFVPDRRPPVSVGMFGGACAYPPAGSPDWWLDLNDLDANGVVDSVDTVLERLDEAYGDGWRRMIMTLPGGSYAGLLASSQWWTMPLAKRQSLTLALPAWLADHPDATLGIYVGFAIADPCRLCMQGCSSCFDCDAGGGPCDLCPECADAEPAHIPRTTDAQDMCVVYQNLEPWIDAGIDEIWFDHSGGVAPPQWKAMLRLAGNPDYAGRVKFGSEPIVNHDQGDGANEPEMDAVERLAFVSLRRYYETRGGNAPPGAWTFDPLTTEVHVFFDSGSFCVDQDPGDGDPCTDCPDWCEGVPDPAPIDVVFDFVQRGYVPHARGGMAAELVRRIFDLNAQAISCPADLDVDGDVDQDDASRLAANMGVSTGATLYHGDLDFDDDVDTADLVLLLSDPHYRRGPCSGD